MWRFELDVTYKDGVRKTITGKEAHKEWSDAYRIGHKVAHKLINTAHVEVNVIGGCK